MVEETPQINDLVIVSGGLGRIVRAERGGWLVTRQRLEPGDGWLPHWTPRVTVAVVGETVCPSPSCGCGLAHLPADELALLGGGS